MPLLAALDAILACDKGSLPSVLGVIPTKPFVNCVEKAAADVDDFKPTLNVRPFGMCSSMDNPAVKTATAENDGMLTPMPCTPMTTSTWESSSIVTIRYVKAIHEGCSVSCKFGGSITIKSAVQTKVNVK